MATRIAGQVRPVGPRHPGEPHHHRAYPRHRTRSGADRAPRDLVGDRDGWAGVASTDFLDGWVARRQGATTSGAFLDPLADKVLVLGALGALAAVGLTSWVPVVVIAGREVAVSAYRSSVARHGVSVPARRLAKLKTASQDLAIGSHTHPAHRPSSPVVGPNRAVGIRGPGSDKRRPSTSSTADALPAPSCPALADPCPP